MSEATRTSPRPDRVLSGPAITFAIPEEADHLRQEPEWVAGQRNSVTVAKTANLSVVVTVLKKDATLCGHEVDGPITLQVIAGAIEFSVAGRPQQLRPGAVIVVEKAVHHEVKALEDSEMLLTIVKDVR